MVMCYTAQCLLASCNFYVVFLLSLISGFLNLNGYYVCRRLDCSSVFRLVTRDMELCGSGICDDFDFSKFNIFCAICIERFMGI